MNECLAHRGPDEDGTYINGPVGLAHKRLSIIGLNTGRQPIFNEDETVCVIFNGEIYNYPQLRDQLVTSGHTFETETDTEVLVHLYEEYGPSFVSHLEGMFAFALWDAASGRLLLARDPMGIKPLLLADDGDSIAFASELPAVLESDVDHGGIDQTAMGQYFSLGYIPAPRTAFENIRKLEPGEQVIISDGEIKRTQFYTPTIEHRDIDFRTAVDELRTRVETAVEKRLMSDVPVGAFLSGGIDSSIVVGTMANQMDDPVKTFTVGFDEALFDESWAAQEVADYHDTDHTEFTVGPDDIRAAIPDVLDRLGEPFADQSLVPTYIVSRETSRNVKVALSGDGADELFAGYSRYRGEYYSKYYRRIPPAVRGSIIEPAVDRLGVSREDERGERIRKVKKFLRGGEPRLSHRHFEWSRIADDETLAGATRLTATSDGHASVQEAHDDAAKYLPVNRQDDLSRIQAVDTRFGLPNQILHKTDQASMYNSLEVRVPFLDTDVVEYALSLPTNYKITAREQKRVLKKAFDDVLPTAILERGKQGFDMPIGEWFKNELEDEFRATVSTLDSDFVDTAAVLRHLDAHKRGTAEHSKHLWSVYVFARWHNRMRDRGVI
ncbi:asparagine synthase (glutamine-hydrolyzing) [Halovenus carboxidivorans]